MSAPDNTKIEEIEEETGGPEIGILDHLNELRIRVTWAAGFVIVGTIIGFAFAEPLLQYLLKPYSEFSPEGAQLLQTLRPTEGIETFFKVALLFGFTLTMPFILHQFWIFVAPALSKKERRYVYVFIPVTLALFLLGIAFAWFILVPASVAFLSNFMPAVFQAEWTGEEYIGFLVTMLFWLGVSFEMPVIIYVTARVGFVSGSTLRQQWRFAVVGIAVLAAVVTPSVDPVTMLLTMAPLFVLYLLSIGMAYLGQRQFEKSMAID